MLSEDCLHNLYKADYMQNPFNILTQENLERLEKHCKKAIHYERGELKEEHEIVLELLYKYQDLESDKQNLINKLKDSISFVKTDKSKESKIKAEVLENVLKIVKGEI